MALEEIIKKMYCRQTLLRWPGRATVCGRKSTVDNGRVLHVGIIEKSRNTSARKLGTKVR